MSDFVELRRRLQELNYPENHHYDPETLAPRGLLKDRMECLRLHAPELFAGGWSLLDVGSNKGFLSLFLANRYKRVLGYEPIQSAVDLADDVRDAHGVSADRVRFYVAALADIPAVASSEVVYAGHFNHHCYAREIHDGCEPYTFMLQLAALTKRILIVDGPFECIHDATARDLALKGEWSEGQRMAFCLAAHAGAIANQFRLLRTGPSGTAQRQIAVFKRT